MIAIANVDKNWGIGKNNNLLLHFKEDMDFFKEKTIGNICIMGRKTLFSFPNNEPLKDRINIVLTKNKNIIEKEYKKYDNIYFFEDKASVITFLKKFNNKKFFVIGGASIYNLFLDDTKVAFITKMKKNFDADTFFPNLDLNKDFSITNISKNKYNIKNDLYYNFITYKRSSINE
ncbi:MAG: dihydrofolate reductase [Eubacteriales bacterium]|nr:dihydrofolate reductase [Eubacteriales bacterium]